MAKLLADFLPVFERFVQRPEDYLNVQSSVATDITDFLKNLYDYTKNVEDGKVSGDALPELIVEDLDQEQIWQELELQNSGRSEDFVTDIAGLVARKKRLVFPIDSEKSENALECDSVGVDVTNDKSEVEVSFEAEFSSNDELSEGKDELALDEIRHKSRRKKGLSRVSEVDDKFFKLSELEEFLEQEDKREAGQHDSSDESVDLFRSSDDEEDQSDNDLHYADFFDNAHNDGQEEHERIEEDETQEEEEEGDGVNDEEEEEEVSSNNKRVQFMLSDDDSDASEKAVKSSLEARQERIQARINKLEEQALAEKPWQMKGEISATGRPQNSLLEEVVEFDLTTRPAPVMTEKTTLQLEDVIKQRVKDQAWDDVERKVKPVETPNEYKKKLVLDQEKSKLSLSQIYEKEYVKQKEAVDADGGEPQEQEEPAEHKEIRKMMSSLFAKLDALSNFHYTPRAPAPEVKIVSNIPAITMEEVAPVAVSDAALLAPEEIKEKPKGELIGKAERTTTDRKRERRQKKARQREREHEREKRQRMVEKLRPGLGNKYSKERAMRDLENVTKSSNVMRMEEKDTDKAVKSSTAFFGRLQDEVKTLIKRKTGTSNSKSHQNVPSAKKLKL